MLRAPAAAILNSVCAASFALSTALSLFAAAFTEEDSVVAAGPMVMQMLVVMMLVLAVVMPRRHGSQVLPAAPPDQPRMSLDLFQLDEHY